jgi:RNA polymerase sigma-70 factor (ECF subfamily)
LHKVKDIIDGCLSGSRRDQELLYRRYAPRLYAVCLRYTGNTEEARDVLQEGFIKIYENLERYSREGSFEGWIRKIIVNTALEKYRNRYYLSRVDDIDGVEEQLSEPDTDDFAGLEATDLLNMIMELPPKYRMVFNLYAIEGYTHKEIGAMLGISEGTSKSNLSRARDILQKKVMILTGVTRRMINV